MPSNHYDKYKLIGLRIKQLMSLLGLFDRSLLAIHDRQFCSLTLSGIVAGQGV